MNLRSGLAIPEREAEIEKIVEQRKEDPPIKLLTNLYDLHEEYLDPQHGSTFPKSPGWPRSPRSWSRKTKERPIIDIPFPFPPPKQLTQKKAEEEAETLSVFSKITVNMPMLTLLSKVPSYAKFLKEFFTNNWKFAEKVHSTSAVSSVL